MMESVVALSAWETFYVIVGSSGGALIGLQFVVITLIAERRPRTPRDSLSAFGTPTVVHLTAALVVSALMSVPWPSRGAASAGIGICGLAGLIYAAIVVRRARSQTGYKPVWQDWLWYAALPSGGYAVLAFGAAMLRARATLALFAIAAAALGLLLVGIHNAWDTVTHLVAPDEPAPEPGEQKHPRR